MIYTAEFHTQSDSGPEMAFRRLSDGRVSIEIDISGLGKTSWCLGSADWAKAVRAMRAKSK